MRTPETIDQMCIMKGIATVHTVQQELSRTFSSMTKLVIPKFIPASGRERRAEDDQV